MNGQAAKYIYELKMKAKAGGNKNEVIGHGRAPQLCCWGWKPAEEPDGLDCCIVQ